MSEPSFQLFRGEALAALDVLPERGDLLRISPAWTRWTYWLLVSGVALGLAFCALSSVNQYARGPAVILRDRAAPDHLSLLVFLPGATRPLLRPGMPLRLALAGLPSEYREVPIASVREEVVGPSEARRQLPPELQDAIPVPGAVALVRADLTHTPFALDGLPVSLHEGMQGSAEIVLRRDNLLLTLVPGMSMLVSHVR